MASTLLKSSQPQKWPKGHCLIFTSHSFCVFPLFGNNNFFFKQEAKRIVNKKPLTTLFRRHIVPCSRFDLVTSAAVLVFSSYQTRRAEDPNSSLLYLLWHHLLSIAFLIWAYPGTSAFLYIKLPQYLPIHSSGYTSVLWCEGVLEWKCFSQPEIWLMYFIAFHSSSQLHMRDTKWSPRGYSSVKKLPLPILCHDDSRDKLMFWRHTGNVLKS